MQWSGPEHFLPSPNYCRLNAEVVTGNPRASSGVRSLRIRRLLAKLVHANSNAASGAAIGMDNPSTTTAGYQCNRS